MLKVIPVDEAVHDAGLRVARRYGLSVYDSMIVGAALTADCDVVWTENMQDGLVIEGTLKVSNPFYQMR